MDLNTLINLIWRLSWADAAPYALNSGIAAGIALAWGIPAVALFKWLKTRKSGAEKRADTEIERIRAEIAARDGQPPVAT